MAPRDCKPWTVGAVRVRRVRGPRADGLVYWRAELNGEQLWAGWGRRQSPELSSQIASLAAGSAAPAPGPGGLPGPQLRHLLGAWRAYQQSRREVGEITPRSLEIYEQAVRYLSRGLGEVLLERLTGAEVRGYVRARLDGRVVLPDRRLGEGKGARTSWRASTRTVHIEMMVLRSLWAWGRNQAFTPDEDLDVPAIKVAPHRDKYTPTRGEVRDVIARLGAWQARMVLLLASTGARRSEIANLRWGDVDLERRELRLDGKTGPRVVPLVVDIGPAGTPDELVLGVTVSTAECIATHLAKACDEAGVTRFTPHGLRRLALDTLYESGADVGVVAKLLGQSPSVALAAYRQPRPDALRRAVEAARLGDLPAGEVVAFPVTGRRHSGEE